MGEKIRDLPQESHTMKKKLISLYERTLNNCKFYLAEGKIELLISEIGCLRGIAYCLEECGVDFYDLPDFIYFIDIANKYR